MDKTAKNQTPKPTQHQQAIQAIHRERYLSTISILPDLRKKKTKDYFEVILTLIALIIAIIFAIYPTAITIVGLNKQLDDAKQLNQQMETKVATLHTLGIQYTALQPELQIILAALPKTGQEQIFAAEIQGLAQQDNLTLTNLSLMPETTSVDTTVTPAVPNPPGTTAILGSFSFTGDPNDMQQFLKDVVGFQRVATIDSAYISHQPKNNINSGTPTNVLTLSVTLKSYYMK